MIENISSIRSRFKTKFTVRKKKEDPTAPEAAKEGAGNTFTAVKDAWVRVATKCLLKENLSPTLEGERQTFQIALLDNDEKDQLDAKLFKNGPFVKNSLHGKEGATDIKTADSFYLKLEPIYFQLFLKKDTTPLLSINLEKIQSITKGKMGCIDINISEDNCNKITLCPEAEPFCLGDLMCSIHNAAHQFKDIPCDAKCDQIKVVEPKNDKPKIQVQPEYINVLSSKNCKYDWTYEDKGFTWDCKCNKGRQQSPINLPAEGVCPVIQENAIWDFKSVKPSEYVMEYYINIVRVRAKPGKNFGKLEDLDGTTYEAYEIQFHTPSEHEILGKQFDLEVQVMYRPISGDFKNQAVLSQLFYEKAGSYENFFKFIDFENLPTKDNNVVKPRSDDGSKTFNLWNLVHKEQYLIESKQPFSYYKYMGSNTQPPCAQNVVWFIASKPRPFSIAMIKMLQKALIDPEKNIEEQEQFLPENNRKIMDLLDRQVWYYKAAQDNFKPSKLEPNKSLDYHFEKFDDIETFYVHDDSSIKPQEVYKTAVVVGLREGLGQFTEEQEERNKLRNKDKFGLNKKADSQ